MVAYVLAAVIECCSGEECLVVRQSPPPPLPEEEYRPFADSDLWDLPSFPLLPVSTTSDTERDDIHRSKVSFDGADTIADKLDLSQFDVASALDQILMQVDLVNKFNGKWKLLKYEQEAEFGPEPYINTLFILGSLELKKEPLPESCKWICKERTLDLLTGVKPSVDRVGPLVFLALFPKSTSFLHCQEYPPGVTIVPMKSRTLKPFHTTNLVIILPKTVDFINSGNSDSDSDCVACGDALIVDPGCCSQAHSQLADLIALLPRKLVAFVTHHHYDHIDGLSVVQKINPDSVLLAHENTMNRIDKGNWSLGYTKVTGGEKIRVGNQLVEVIYAPGHTDGHLALLHVNTNSLIVGDHCVGQGSAVLDTRAGGSMKDYFDTTYKFLELSPNVLIPMHGRINLWPKRMLCGYLKHRRERESSILKSIESGAHTLYDIIASCYADVDTKYWILASFNVRLHVDYLDYQKKLPVDFSLENFNLSYDEFHSKISVISKQ